MLADRVLKAKPAFHREFEHGHGHEDSVTLPMGMGFVNLQRFPALQASDTGSAGPFFAPHFGVHQDGGGAVVEHFVAEFFQLCGQPCQGRGLLRRLRGRSAAAQCC